VVSQPRHGVRRVGAAWFIIAFCLALILNLLGFMTLAGVLPQIIADWRLSNTDAGWLGGIFFAGYVVGVPVLTGLTDRVDPRRIYLASAVVAALSHFAFAFLAEGFWSGLGLRLIAGLGLAGTYLPGMKAMTDHLEGRAQSRGITYYTSVFALGSGLSILVAGEAAAWLSWRWAFAVAGIGALASLAIVARVLPAAAPAPGGGRAGFAGDFRTIVGNRRVMAYVLLQFGTAWEVFAARTWLVVYFVALQGYGEFPFDAVATATVVALIGVPAAMALGEAAQRFDRRWILIFAAAVSIAATLAVGATSGGAYWVTLALCLVLGMFSFGKTAPTAGGTVAAAPPGLRGTAIAVHGAIGFCGGILGPLSVGIALDLAGGIGDMRGWAAGFAAMAFGPAFGLVAIAVLGRGVARLRPSG
jgi:MFS family permease